MQLLLRVASGDLLDALDSRVFVRLFTGLLGGEVHTGRAGAASASLRIELTQCFPDLLRDVRHELVVDALGGDIEAGVRERFEHPLHHGPILHTELRQHGIHQCSFAIGARSRLDQGLGFRRLASSIVTLLLQPLFESGEIVLLAFLLGVAFGLLSLASCLALFELAQLGLGLTRPLLCRVPVLVGLLDVVRLLGRDLGGLRLELFVLVCHCPLRGHPPHLHPHRMTQAAAA